MIPIPEPPPQARPYSVFRAPTAWNPSAQGPVPYRRAPTASPGAEYRWATRDPSRRTKLEDQNPRPLIPPAYPGAQGEHGLGPGVRL